MQENFLELKNISKVFPGVKALDDVSFSAKGGRVTGLIGVNGAGKSTLMNIIGGVSPATSGTLELNGEVLQLNVPQDSENCGIGFIHQEPVMFNYMTVAENISISKIKGVVNYKQLNAIAKTHLKTMDCTINPKTIVGNLSIGDRQMVEIARAISTGGKVLLFDEPTASFSSKEKKRLFEVIKSLKEQGTIIFFISHFLDEIEEITDDLVVLRDGKVVLTGETKNISRNEILDKMIGGEIKKVDETVMQSNAPVMFKVNGLNIGKNENCVDFAVKQGEIVGIWGLMGSGRTEMLRAIYGLDKVSAGNLELLVDGKLKKISFKEIRNHCGYVTEARHDDGLFLPWSIWENIASANLKMFRKPKSLFLDYKKQQQVAEDYLNSIHIKAPNIYTKIESLSGGNQQKAIMAKWLYRKPSVFLLDEPTRGVDVGAKAEIHQLVKDLAKNGSAVIVVSSEIEEISSLSDRVLVLNRGKINAEVMKQDIEKETLMKYCV